jgi:hypothetical protein
MAAEVGGMTFTDDYHEWNEVTGAIPKGTSWDFEIESIFEDADNRVSELERTLRTVREELIEGDTGVKQLVKIIDAVGISKPEPTGPHCDTCKCSPAQRGTVT